MSNPTPYLKGISTPHGTPSAALTRALAYRDAVQELKAQGVTGLRCPDCGFVHSIARINQSCNAHTHEGACTSTAPLIPVLPALSLSNGQGQRVEVRYTRNGAGL